MRDYSESYCDRRRFARVRPEGIRGNILSASDLDVVDISVGGAAVLTGRRVELNREYTVRFHCADGSFHVRVRVIWALLTSKVTHDERIVPLYKAGVEFLDVSAEKRDAIRRCIEPRECDMPHRNPSRITYCF